MDCIFCKIANKEIPSQFVFENEYVVAFRDLAPQAPVHILAVPKIHITSMNEITKENSHIVAEIFEAINKITESEGIRDSGYRVISNCGRDGCQSVQHLHFHILGGKKLSESLA
ncbi:MAG TPA: histidine triad nucleotide-binding protein [Sedimentibacter sp.]|jgi:histidine triad (HIT) family protein|nr:histidine triad nucleotide-binding protein [Sedimentibacter sp.]NLA13681.1 histidine triad nucleotide-binding protein [Tissierellia bacterium]HAS90730.1 histidine triad nucleotide-binding protein [Clostridiales bacterium]HOA19126.1 histidine triad nucleotide-binding protein [Sedimentibacter sp.]HOG62307.1 histidine triad nucleotide-binding protein [Sedimentibacter sp.]